MPDTQKLAVILFADIEGYTAMMQEDQEMALSVLNRFKLVLEAETAQQKGQVIQYLGDGALLTFDSAERAVTCAMAMQSALQTEPFVPVRIGLHLGDVLFKEGNVFGDGVNLASRIESLSVPGAVLMSKTIRDQLKNKPNFQLTSLGEFEFKNVQEPVEVFALANEGFPIPDPKTLTGKLKTKRKPQNLLRNLVLVGALALASFVAYYNWGAASPPPVDTTEIETLEKSIAVLPFRNLSGDESQQFFSDGMSEEILNALTQIKDLKVIARASSFQFRGDAVDLQEVGEKLGVTTVLEGSVRRDGSRVRILATLVNIEEEQQLWSQRFDREVQDVFEVQDEIARAITDQLELSLVGVGSGGNLVKRLTDNKKAYDLYLEAKHLHWLGRFQEAIKLEEKAIELDPGFAAAYAWLALSKFVLIQPLGKLLNEQAAAEVRKLAEKAYSLDPTSSDAIDAMIYVYHDFDLDYKKAFDLLQHAAQSQPSSRIYGHMAYNLLQRGSNIDSILQYAQKAKSLDRLNLIPYFQLAVIHYFARRPKQLPVISKEVKSLFPPSLYQAWTLYTADMGMGDYETATERFEPLVPAIEANALTPMYMYYLFSLAKIDAERGRKKLEAFKSDVKWLASPTAIAMVHLALGDKEVVYQYLEKAIQVKDFTTLNYLRYVPYWDELRGEPRFQELLKQLDEHLPSFNGRGWGIPYLDTEK